MTMKADECGNEIHVEQAQLTSGSDLLQCVCMCSKSLSALVVRGSLIPWNLGFADGKTSISRVGYAVSTKRG